MKTTLIVLIFVFAGLLVEAQKLTLDNLLYLQKSDEAQINDFLTEKEWSFIKSDTAQGHYQITWAHGYINLSVDTMKKNESVADGWLFLRKASANNDLVITYQMSSSSNYTILINKIKNVGMKRIESKVGFNTLKQVYQFHNIVIVFLTTARDGDSEYLFQVMTYDEYLINKIIQSNNKLLK